MTDWETVKEQRLAAMSAGERARWERQHRRRVRQLRRIQWWYENSCLFRAFWRWRYE